jgi:tetratricopeptide (TPR) repeat protein
MKGYTTRDVESLLGLPRRQARELGRSGVLDPDRGAGNRYLFSFQDLVLLRTAKELLDADVPQGRVLRSLRHVKEQLPDHRSLTGVRIAVEGDDVLVQDEGRAWHPESGQLRFVFDVRELAEQVEPLDQRAMAGADGAAEWQELGEELESHAPGRAREAFEKVLELEPDHAGALGSLGRILHEEGNLEGAVVHYRRALEASGGDDPLAAFNLGLALEELGRHRAAADAYNAALTIDPAFADAHRNLSRVYEKLGDNVSALRHLKSYRTLTGKLGGH